MKKCVYVSGRGWLPGGHADRSENMEFLTGWKLSVRAERWSWNKQVSVEAAWRTHRRRERTSPVVEQQSIWVCGAAAFPSRTGISASLIFRSLLNYIWVPIIGCKTFPQCAQARSSVWRWLLCVSAFALLCRPEQSSMWKDLFDNRYLSFFSLWNITFPLLSTPISACLFRMLPPKQDVSVEDKAVSLPTTRQKITRYLNFRLS